MPGKLYLPAGGGGTHIKSVQRILTSGFNGTALSVNLTINEVVPANCVVRIQVGNISNGANCEDALVRAEFNSGTDLDLNRYDNVEQIARTVVEITEYEDAVVKSSQVGIASITDPGTGNWPINSVDLNKCDFSYTQRSGVNTGEDLNDALNCTLYMNSSTNLILASGHPSNYWCYYRIIEFN